MAKKKVATKKRRVVRRKATIAPLDLISIGSEESKKVTAAPTPKKRRSRKAARHSTTLKPYRPRKDINKLTGVSDRKRDLRYHAKSPGRRVSASGGMYYEWRRNRADYRPSRGL